MLRPAGSPRQISAACARRRAIAIPPSVFNEGRCETCPDGLALLDPEPPRARRGDGVSAAGLYGLWLLASAHSYDQSDCFLVCERALPWRDSARVLLPVSGHRAPPDAVDRGLARSAPHRPVRMDASRCRAWPYSSLDLTRERVSRTRVHDHAASHRPEIGHARSARGRIATGWRRLALRGRDPRRGEADRGCRIQQRLSGELRGGWIYGGRSGRLATASRCGVGCDLPRRDRQCRPVAGDGPSSGSGGGSRPTKPRPPNRRRTHSVNGRQLHQGMLG